jgi:hypothetical protein
VHRIPQQIAANAPALAIACVQIVVSASASIKAALRHRVAGSIAPLKRIAQAISLARLSGVSWMFAVSFNEEQFALCSDLEPRDGAFSAG